MTLDKTDTEDTVALYSNNFIFRKEIIHELTDYDSHQRNAMAYQDYDNLSPYLQAYLTSRFGDEAKSNGAYVIIDKAIDEYRSVDIFMPRRSRIENSYDNIQFGVQYNEKSESACFDSSLVNDNELNSLYSSMFLRQREPCKRTSIFMHSRLKIVVLMSLSNIKCRQSGNIQIMIQPTISSLITI